jgi:transcriptional regulator with XRE-family HTH domain
MTQAEKSLWKALQLRLVRATIERGARSELASLMGVSRQVVSAWLRGASAPTAETTLRLLAWVSAEEERTKKRAGSESMQPALTTRKRKSKHENK